MAFEPITPIQMAVRTLPKRRRLKKPAVLLFPRIIEKKYLKVIREIVKSLQEKTKNILVPELQGLTSEGIVRDWLHFDQTAAEKLKQLLQSVSASVDTDYGDTKIDDIVKVIGEDINGFNRAQVHKVFKSVLGVDIFTGETGITGEVLSSFVAENVSLITSIKQQYLSQTEQVVLRGIRSGLRHEEIAKQLLSRSNKKGFKSRIENAESRAELIARDQTNKLYGQLTEIRQTEAGIEKYIWRTALDSGVRPEHEEREGQVFSWNDPPSDGHPGEATNCRCYAEPIIDLKSI